MGILQKDFYVFDDINLYTETKSNISSAAHCHDFYEFFYIIQGSIRHIIEGREEVLSIGDIRFIPPSITHEIYSNGGSLHRDFVIPKEYFENLCTLLRIEKSFFYDNANGNSWKLSLKQINILETQVDLFCNESSDLQRKRCLGLNLINTILTLICDLKNNDNASSVTLPFCVQFLVDNINTPDFLKNNSIGTAIKQIGYSPSYVSHLFKKTIGMSISDYVKEKRALHIEHYLKNTDYSLQEICNLVGLNNLSHLNNLFKAKYQVSPMKYRKKYNNKAKTLFENKNDKNMQ